ncbi:MAG: carbohydrate kinase family protein [Pseudomonadota bacterium]
MKAITFGSAMIDSIAIISDDRIERMSMRNADSSFLLLEEGRKTEAEQISQHVGGGAVNTAVAMARLGFDVATVLKVGQDDRAETVLRRLADEKISTRFVMREAGAETGAAVVVSSHERDAAIFTFRGANTTLKVDELKPDMMSADLVYISGLSNRSADCFPAIVKGAKDAGAKVATNPGIRQLTSRAQPFLEALPLVDVLSINRREADALVPQLIARFGEGGSMLELKPGAEGPELALRYLGSGGCEMSLIRFAEALLSFGIGTLLVTNGRDGGYVATKDGIHHCPVMSIDVVGTAGAGDAFASTFSAVLAKSADPVRALRSATVNSSSVVGHSDTQTGLLSTDQIEDRLDGLGRDALEIQTWPLL